MESLLKRIKKVLRKDKNRGFVYKYEFVLENGDYPNIVRIGYCPIGSTFCIGSIKIIDAWTCYVVINTQNMIDEPLSFVYCKNFSEVVDCLNRILPTEEIE